MMSFGEVDGEKLFPPAGRSATAAQRFKLIGKIPGREMR